MMSTKPMIMKKTMTMNTIKAMTMVMMKPLAMPRLTLLPRADNASQKSQGSSSGGGPYTNGHSGGVSPNSSQLSMEGRESTLITRTQKQHITQNVSIQTFYEQPVCSTQSQPKTNIQLRQTKEGAK